MFQEGHVRVLIETTERGKEREGKREREREKEGKRERGKEREREREREGKRERGKERATMAVGTCLGPVKTVQCEKNG
jgi:hypothetical protein